MYDWFKAHGPMSIADERLKSCISENFPSDAIAHVNNCGGIHKFLQQSFSFAMIDDFISIKEQAISSQELVVLNSLAKFESYKCLIR